MAKGGVRSVMDAYEEYGIAVPSCAKELIILMLQSNPADRPTLEEVMQHPFFDEEEEWYVSQPLLNSNSNSIIVIVMITMHGAICRPSTCHYVD